MEKPIKSYAVALMAGGRSSRMGRDKARLVDRDGKELWRGRLELLVGVAGWVPGWSGETLISCREDQNYLSEAGAERVRDVWPEAGPLGGIVGCLEKMTADLLLVMAVDLPSMNREVLTALLTTSMESDCGGKGAVFCLNGFYEPLAAVYPKAMAPAGRRRLEAGQGALRDWIAESRDWMCVMKLPEKWIPAFRNVNGPADWERWLGESGAEGNGGEAGPD